ncbi:acyltransferase [Klebsiella aerogenes]
MVDVMIFQGVMVKRIFWLDAARAIAIILVVFTHAHERAGIHSEMLRSIFYGIDRLGVPLFFMISGGLILPKLVNCNLLAFYKKRIPQFIVLLVVWSVITNYIKYSVEGKGFWEALTLSVINNNGIYPSNYGGASQMWFMYSITQLYLIAPFLAKMLNKSSNKEVIIFLLVCMLFNQFKHTATFFGGDWGALHRMGEDFTGPYLIYFILGYLIIERSIWYGEKFIYLIIYFLTTTIPVVSLVLIDYLTGKVNDGLHWYSGSLFIVLSGVGLILLVKWLFLKASNKIMSCLSVCSFGIYLTHYAFIYVMQGIMKDSISLMSDVERMMLYFSFSLVAGVLFTYLMMKTKPTKYLVS